MSIRAFAAHLGVSASSVANWEKNGAEIRLRYETQEILDRDLSRAPDEVRSRFHASLAVPPLARLPLPISDYVEDGVDRRSPLKGATSPVFAALVDAVANPFCGAASTNSQNTGGAAQLRGLLRQCRYAYQHSQYATASHKLTTLLALLPDDGRQAVGQAAGLLAESYQVASGLLLKAGEPALAAICAERSFGAALASEDELIRASSMRAVVHTLLSGGHPGRAAAVAIQAADRLTSTEDMDAPSARSLYGALLLRGAVAAGRHGDRDQAHCLLDGADAAAKRLEGDGDRYWTAFGATNVAVHRVAVAVDLGDAGAAVGLGSRVDLTQIDLPERRAMFLIDLARAFAQWGKWDQALASVQHAERHAPEEVRSRPDVHGLLLELVRSTPPASRRLTHEYAQRVGALT